MANGQSGCFNADTYVPGFWSVKGDDISTVVTHIAKDGNTN